MVIVGRIALPLGRGRNAGDGQFLWPRRPPIIGHYQTLQTMVIVGRIALPLGRGRNAGDGQFLWPRRPPIIGHYRTLQTMVIVGRITLPLGAWAEGCRCRWYDWQSEFSSVATGPMTFGRVPCASARRPRR